MRPRRGRVVIAVLVLLLVAIAAACGDDDNGGSTDNGPDPARDQELAQAIAFHQYDLPAGWEQIDFGATGSPPTMETLSECLGQATTPTATFSNGYHFGPGTNQVAVVEVRVLRTAAAAAKVIAPTVAPPFAPCVVDRVKRLFGSSLGADLGLQDLTGAPANVATAGANGIAIDMTAHITSPTGLRTSYPAAVFLQKGRVVAIVTTLSNNLSVVDLSRTLATAVANRMPAE